MKKNPTNGREPILEAAIRVASRDGVLSMTLDHVAQEAKMSKGGLLYHFASKDELVTAMIEHFGRKAEQAMNTAVAEDVEPEGRWIRAIFNTALGKTCKGRRQANYSGADEGTDTSRFFMALIAAIVVNPKLILPVKDIVERVRARILADKNGQKDLMTWLAIDGLWLWQLVGIISVDDPLWKKIVKELRNRTLPLPKERGVKKKVRSRTIN